MAIEFPQLTYRGIIMLAQNPCPECELDKMSQGELYVLNERIDKIVNDNPHDENLYAKLMRVRSFSMLKMK